MSENNKENEQGLMTLLEHLFELKDHLIRIAVALIVAGMATFAFSKQILIWLLRPMQKYEGQYAIQATTPTTTIGVWMKIALFSGAIVAMPFIVYQVLHYVLPALTRKEKIALVWIIPGATVFFLGGAAFAYFIMVPAAIPFLLGLWADVIQQNWMVDEYLPFITGLIFWVGVAFETPLLMAFVSRLGVVTAKQMLKVWKFAVVIMAVLAAFITPTPDPFNMALVMTPLIMLYFLGVFLAWVAKPNKARVKAEVEAGT